MDVNVVNEAKEELKRLQRAIEQLDEVLRSGCDKKNQYYVGGKETAAVKRASMDVTRVLTRLRKL